MVDSKINEAKDILGETGRIVVRPSGTEPLIRVMVEGKNEELINSVANAVANTIKERLCSK